MSFRSGLLAASVLTSVSLCLTGLAHAQQGAQSSGDSSKNEEQTEEKKSVEKVVVTGSRIKRSEFNSPDPVQVITNEQSTLRGQTDAANILQTGTLAAGSQQINNQLTGFVAEGGPGVNTVSLRGLGATRTLVLLNGRRLSPAGVRGQVGAVDLNVLPQSVLNRYEILKDGASSVYGSDAVAGVINAITIKGVDGGAVNVSYSSPFKDGTTDTRLDGRYSETFGDLSVLIAGEYYERSAQLIGDREITACTRDNVTNVTDGFTSSGAAYPVSLNQAKAGQTGDIIDPLTGRPKCFNQLYNVVDIITSVPGGRYVIDPTAVLGGGTFGLDRPGLRRVGLSLAQVNTAPGTAALTNQQKLDLFYQTQGAVPNDHPNLLNRTYISPATRKSVYGELNYNLFAQTDVYVEFLANQRTSEQKSFRQLFPNVSNSNPNNPTGFVARSIISIPSNGEQQVDYYRGVVGVKGELGDVSEDFLRGLSFDVYFQTSKSEATYTNDIIYNDRVNAVTGSAACNNALITISGTAPFGSCATVPSGVRWFNQALVASQGVFSGFTQAERDFLFTRETGTTTYDQSTLSGTLSASLFDLPAGPLEALVGFEKKTDEIDDTPGLQARQGNLWGQTSAGRTAGTDSTIEAFGEIEVPLLRDSFLAKGLTFNASGRATKYDSYGSENTYKLGVNWQITDEYRFRATQGTSFRAPALFELFLANQTAFTSQASIDPCFNWDTSANPQIVQNCGPLGANLPPGYIGGGSASALVITGGGAGVLSAETSDARTFGFIWTPKADWLPPIRVAVDYFDMEVNNQVAQLGSANILGQCYTAAVYLGSPYCSLFVRNLTGAPVGTTNPGGIISVNNSYVNINSQDIKGMDLTFQYRDEFDFGLVTVDFQGTFAFDQDQEFLVGLPRDNNGDIYYNDFVGVTDLRLDNGNWTFVYSSRMYSRSSNNEDIGDTIFGYRGQAECGTPAANTPFLQNTCIEAYYKQFAEFTMTHDLSVRYRTEKWSFQAGLINFTDELAPVTSSGAGTTRIGEAVAISNYDATGRRLFLNFGYAF